MDEVLTIGVRVDRKLAEVTERLASQGVTFEAPTVIYDLKGLTVGMAVGKHLIRLNLAAISDPRYTEDMFTNTLPHEVAHIVVAQNWPGEPFHGKTWAWIMVLLGLKPERCHNYEMAPARRARKNPKGTIPRQLRKGT